ncbi:hypothetical protein ACFL3V_04945 [Nanoarchaeota archaeon]
MGLTPPTKYLLEWFVRYTRNRDIVFRKISEIKEEGNVVVVCLKDGTVVHYYIDPFPDDISELVSGIKEEHVGVVMYNSKENFGAVVSAWKKLAAVKNLTLYFINPFSKLEKRWIIKPSVHSRVTAPEALEEGLNSMYVMVEPISAKEVESLTK